MRAFFNKLGFLALVVVAVVSFSSPAFAGDNELEALMWVSIVGKSLNPQDEDISVAPGFSPFAHFILPNGMGEGNWIMGNPFRVPQGTLIQLDFGISDPGARLRRIGMKALSSSPNVLIPEFEFETKNTPSFTNLDGLPVIWDQSVIVLLDTARWPAGSIVQLQLTAWYKVTVSEEIPIVSFVFGPFDGSEWVPQTRQIFIEVLPVPTPKVVPTKTPNPLPPAAQSSTPIQLFVYENNQRIGTKEAYRWNGGSNFYLVVEPQPRFIHWEIEIEGEGTIKHKSYEGICDSNHSQLFLKQGNGVIKIVVWDPENPQNRDEILIFCGGEEGCVF